MLVVRKKELELELINLREEDVVCLYTPPRLIYLPICNLLRRHMAHLVYPRGSDVRR